MVSVCVLGLGEGTESFTEVLLVKDNYRKVDSWPLVILLDSFKVSIM